MTESDDAGRTHGEPAQIRCIEDALRSLVGKIILVSTTDSLQAVPLGGHQVKPSCYRAKIVKVFDGMAVLTAESSRKRKKDEKPGTLKQYLALNSVKRVCVDRDEYHLHL